jgi:lactoylglutathione lyase
LRWSARVVGINHVALEVGDVDEALEFYGRLFSSLFASAAATTR